MPELPEVEITRRGIEPGILGQTITGVVVRNRNLRWRVPRNLALQAVGRRILQIRRRGKYLLLDCGNGGLIVHLGMSGSLRLIGANTTPQKHDHLDIVFGDTALRLRDPRRFGAVLWKSGDIETHPLLAKLGVEPLGEKFTVDFLYRATRGRRVVIKQLLMNSGIVVGVGNIYASESLFRAGIRPHARAGNLSLTRCASLVQAVRETLQAAILAGGSSLRDFVHSDGASGYFQLQTFVYDRAGLPCRICFDPVRMIRQGQRSSFYCAKCQK